MIRRIVEAFHLVDLLAGLLVNFMLPMAVAGISVVVTLAFLLMKIFGAISWPWLTVFMPILIGIPIAVVLYLLGVVLVRAIDGFL